MPTIRSVTSGASPCRCVWPERRLIRKRSSLLTELVEDVHRDEPVLSVDARPHGHQTIGGFIRQRVDERVLEHGERREGGSESHCQGRDTGERVSGLPAKPAAGVTEHVGKGAHQIPRMSWPGDEPRATTRMVAIEPEHDAGAQDVNDRVEPDRECLVSGSIRSYPLVVRLERRRHIAAVLLAHLQWEEPQETAVDPPVQRAWIRIRMVRNGMHLQV